MNEQKELKKLQASALRYRQQMLAMAYHAGGAHLSPAFSITELLTFLFHRVLEYTPEKFQKEDRDRFVLSKGHGCLILYTILADLGFFSESELRKYGTMDGILGGHPDMQKIPGVEASTGSLGHGFVTACGMALGARLKGWNSRIFCLLGDGECQEGSIWEAALLAGNLGLENFIGMIDYNKLQGMGPVDEISDLEPITSKWKSFGWGVREIDGHDLNLIQETFNDLPFEKGKPSMIVCHTIKGKGVSFMENKTIWHYKLPKGEDMSRACLELNISEPIGEVLK